MAWEVFTAGRLQLDSPAVTITSLGRMIFNQKAVEILQSAGAVYVELMVDRDNALIGIRPVREAGNGAIQLKFKGSDSLTFSCVKFLNHIGYDWTESRTFVATLTTTGKLLLDIPRGLMGRSTPIRRDEQLLKRQREKELDQEKF